MKILAMVIVSVVFCAGAVAQRIAKPQATSKPLAIAGAYYFEGWTRESHHLTPRLTQEFFDREPIWGWHDDTPQIMEQQIDSAVDNALSFFAFDWYYPEAENKQTPLNTGLDLYLKAKNKSRLQFCLMVANHSGFRVGPKDWDALCDIWIKLFKEPTHLRVDGKPLLIFFLPRELTKAFSGSDGVKKAFETLRAKAISAGLPGVTIAACATPGPENHWNDLQQLAAEGYSCFTGYNYHGYPMKGDQKIQAFATMIEGHEDIWRRFAEKSPLPYMPVVTSGWDKRPWEDVNAPEKREAYYPDRTPTQVADFVHRAIKWMDDHPDKTTKERVMLIYAWNENGEGGYLAPTKSQGDAYLSAVNKVLQPGP